MSNESKAQEWFYLQNETWNGPFKTSGLKELVKKGIVDPSTLLRIGITGVPIKAHQIKSLFPNYQGNKQVPFVIQKNESNHRWYQFGKFHYTNNEKIVSGLICLAIFVAASTIIIFEIMSKHVPKLSPEEGIASIEKGMVMVPAGRFVMGSPANEKGHDDDDTQHEVTLTKPFYMGKYEVTQEQWHSIMGKNPSITKGGKLPVTDVTWDDCKEFIKKLNAKTSGGYRLPTEAEWEYACRAGTRTAYSFGDSLTKSDANILAASVKAVGNYKPNGFGLYDMHGNAAEWCEDWKADYPEGSVTDPKGPATGARRVFRGGSSSQWLPGSITRSSFRGSDEPTFMSGLDFVGTGLRLARTK